MIDTFKITVIPVVDVRFWFSELHVVKAKNRGWIVREISNKKGLPANKEGIVADSIQRTMHMAGCKVTLRVDENTGIIDWRNSVIVYRYNGPWESTPLYGRIVRNFQKVETIVCLFALCNNFLPKQLQLREIKEIKTGEIQPEINSIIERIAREFVKEKVKLIVSMVSAVFFVFLYHNLRDVD